MSIPIPTDREVELMTEIERLRIANHQLTEIAEQQGLMLKVWEDRSDRDAAEIDRLKTSLYKYTSTDRRPR